MRTIVTALLALVVALSVARGAAAAGRDAERSAGRVVDDAKISMSLKAKLVADKLSNLTKIDVRVKNGIVRLAGTVDTAEQRSHAEDLARRTEGVQEVVNEIRVATAPSAAPR